MRSHRITAILILSAFLLCIPLSSGVPRQSRSAIFDGSLQAAEIDNVDDAVGTFRHRRILFLNTARGELLELDNAPAELESTAIGRQIRVQGFLRDGKLVVEQFEPIEYPRAYGERALLESAPQAGQASDTLGAQKTLVALFNFADVPNRPFTLDSVRTKILTAAKSTDNFLKENSYGKLWLDVDFVDWHTLQGSSNQLCTGAT
jgi:hypothetical protein